MIAIELTKDPRFKNIYYVDSFERDYKKLFKSNLSEYTKEHERLAVNLATLDSCSKETALRLQQFETLSNHSPLCSIRHVSKSNPRVIFVFSEMNGAIILLACTLEKSKKDYNQVIDLAEKRLNQLKED